MVNSRGAEFADQDARFDCTFLLILVMSRMVRHSRDSGDESYGALEQAMSDNPAGLYGLGAQKQETRRYSW